MRCKNHIIMLTAIIIILFAGCGNKTIDFINHNAIKMMEQGIYEIRYSDSNGFEDNYPIVSRISVNVLKDMTKEQMLDIIRYEEMCQMSVFDGNENYIGRRENDYECYAVYYKGDTDEVIDKIKYVNGKIVDIDEADDVRFAPSYFTSKEVEKNDFNE